MLQRVGGRMKRTGSCCLDAFQLSMEEWNWPYGKRNWQNKRRKETAATWSVCIWSQEGRKPTNKQKQGWGVPKQNIREENHRRAARKSPSVWKLLCQCTGLKIWGKTEKKRGKNSALCGNTCGYYLCGGRRMPQPLAPWCCFWLRKNSFKRSGDTSQERWREERDDQTFPAVHYFSTGFQTRVFVFHPPERI